MMLSVHTKRVCFGNCCLTRRMCLKVKYALALIKSLKSETQKSVSFLLLGNISSLGVFVEFYYCLLHMRQISMHSQIFEAWLQKWDSKLLGVEERYVALLVDDCMAHSHTLNFEFVELIFLPSNTTSKIQPCDQGS